MENLKLSPIRIENITLHRVEFSKILPECEINAIPTNAISMSVETETLSETSGKSSLDLSLYKDATDPHPFEFRSKFEMTFSLTDPSLTDAFKMFLNVGAPFNLLVYTRDLLMSLTNRAYKKTIVLPLLDIREFALLVAKKSTSEEGEAEQSMQEPAPNPAPKE
jgi:hypothetical protein